jgi:hypothetical protein
MDMAARGTLTDAVTGDPDAPPITVETMRQNLAGLNNAPVQRVILAALDIAQGDIDRTRVTIEKWYDSGMDRVSGWYKRSTSWVIFWIGLGVSAAININTITIADYLYRNDAARQALVVSAQRAVADTGYLGLSYQQAKAALDSTNLPIGWSKGWGAPSPLRDRARVDPWFDFAAPLLGILFTAIAATYGAPFWFDLLNKMMVIRSTVKPHEKSGEEGSEDRKKPKQPDTAPEKGETDAGVSVVMSRSGVADTRPASFASPLAPRASPRDEASNVDGCDVEMAGVPNVTSDEDLPPAEGGVD